jgi:ubiquitin-conjugating enzyme E2 G2
MSAQALAQKRLLHEYRAITKDPLEGILAGPASEDNLFVWECLLSGPADTPFEGGLFPCTLTFPKDYPIAPPKMKFDCDIWHPNGESLAS